MVRRPALLLSIAPLWCPCLRTNKSLELARVHASLCRRLSQILNTCFDMATFEHVLRAELINPQAEPSQHQYAPHSCGNVVRAIYELKPSVVFAPHVETSTGIMLSDDYIRQVSDTVHKVGGLMVLDCIASGAIWVDMQATGVDVLISAPQKTWSGPACAGLVMLSERALREVKGSTVAASSFVCDLRKWLEVMEAYESGGFAYHATMPTDALVMFRDSMLETQAYGVDLAKDRALELGCMAHGLLCNERRFVRVAAPGFEAPGVVVRG